MGCNFPLRAWKLPPGVCDSEGRTIVFSDPRGRYLPRGAFSPKCEEILIPCGQCMGCRLQHSLEWAVRLEHESTLHPHSVFLTLTYNDDELPDSDRFLGGNLHYKDLQDFWKRLRKNSGQKLRYYSAGEYGDQTKRAHFHAIVFGYLPGDLQLYKVHRGHYLFLSEFLTKTWGHGYVVVAPVTFETCAYVARYVLKKRRKSMQDYESYYYGREPEKALMSRRPGIARDFVEKYLSDIYPSDIVICSDGKRKLRPPKYYDKIYDNVDHEALKALKDQRKNYIKQKDVDPQRLFAREIIMKDRVTMKKRSAI